MNVVNKPDSLSLTGNINPIVVATTKELTFVLKKGDEQILSQSFNPGTSGSVTIKIGDILNNQLSFTLKEATSYYLQNSIFATFTATLTDSDGSTDITFVAIRSGVSQLSDTPSEFLKYNFLTWQPTVKRVTYYTPEYLTYYAVVPGKMQIKATYQDATSETKTIVSMDAGTAVTVPLQYGIVYGMFGKLPAFYDVWYEDASGNVLSYIQRYVADNAKSENEQWILFTNSLGGVDTFRAYGEEEFTGEHTHNLVEIDDTNEEYRVDTVSKHKKYTGHLTTYERQWMQDFFPSLNKFIYSNGEARKIVIIESEDTYNDLDQVGGFSFTYKYTETDAYLNLQRNTQLPKDLNINVPDLANFTLPPRLLEFPTLSGREGVLFPAQKIYADKWGKISLDDIITFAVNTLLNLDNASNWNNAATNSHTHSNKKVLDEISQTLLDNWNNAVHKDGNENISDIKNFLQGLKIAGKPLSDIILSTDNISDTDIKDSSVLSALKSAGMFLRKDKEDSTEFLVKLLGGILTTALKSDNFESGQLGNGFGIYKKADGKSYMEVDELLVRVKAIFSELEIHRLSYLGGNIIFSSAGSKIVRVEETSDAYRCYFMSDDGTTATTNGFVIGDQVRCQTFNIKTGKYASVANKYYWRLVTAVGDDYVELSKTDCDGTDVPATGDSIVQMGNRTDAGRQNLIEIVVTGDDAPAFIEYAGVNSYSLEGKRKTVLSPKGDEFVAKSFKIQTEDGSVTDLTQHTGYRVEKFTSPMFEFYTEGQTTYKATLAIRVFYNEKDITDTLPSTRFVWSRVSENTGGDPTWNELHQSSANSIDIIYQDLAGDTAFICQFLDNDKVVISTTHF